MSRHQAKSVDGPHPMALPPVLSTARARVAIMGYQQPLLYISTEQLRSNARRFMAAMPRVRPHFAVKSNPDRRVLEAFQSEGVHFEIASRAELAQLLAIRVPPDSIFYSNPIKPEDYIRYASSHGVRWFAVDSVAEVDKLHRLAPKSSLYLRISVSNQGSAWPLDCKFGVIGREAEEVMDACMQWGMDLAGVTFHVGSQCLNPDNWLQGIRVAQSVFGAMRQRGFRPRLLNLGGGFPVQMSPDVPPIGEIGELINGELAAIDNGITIIAEPGRNLVASAGCLVTRVIGTAVRNGQRWLYLDTGIYGGLMEFNERFRYPVITDRQGDLVSWTIAGPTCDSLDVCLRDQLLPADLQSQDLLFLPFTGAYTSSCATRFNGFPPPMVVVVS
ncbi:MAG: type III PLP-dependent enzyme [Porticoccaceae bacterium]